MAVKPVRCVIGSGARCNQSFNQSIIHSLRRGVTREGRHIAIMKKLCLQASDTNKVRGPFISIVFKGVSGDDGSGVTTMYVWMDGWKLDF